MIELYQTESCPFCKKVRVKLEQLDVSYVSRPCAPNSKNRDKLQELGGKQQVPFLVNSDTKLYESDDIIKYLDEKYP